MDANPDRRPRELLVAFGQPFSLRIDRQGRADVHNGPLAAWTLGMTDGRTIVRKVSHVLDRERWAFQPKGRPTIKVFTAPGIVAASFEMSALSHHARYLWQKPVVVRIHGVASPDASPHPDHDAAAGGLLSIALNTQRRTRKILAFENNPASRSMYNALRALAQLLPDVAL
ncbi:hypothetical protein PsYK624_123350 [Phanerochaete sordida]|uniref:Uncharacterized protein n=1 Tax=Phanerochaete sordida TaxID=48140 RepID=A0A9P3GID9_9APHY|nr:hypothetical protein PsYK624_123350 [Phanerochaete sordida]